MQQPLTLLAKLLVKVTDELRPRRLFVSRAVKSRDRQTPGGPRGTRGSTLCVGLGFGVLLLYQGDEDGE